MSSSSQTFLLPSTSPNPPELLVRGIGGPYRADSTSIGAGRGLWFYNSTADGSTVWMGAGYFTDGKQLGMRRGDILILAGGELGEISGYDLKARQSLTFAGSTSAQLNQIAPLSSGTLAPDRFLVLRNNAPGFAVLDFAARGERSAETRRLDLGHPSLLGEIGRAHV